MDTTTMVVTEESKHMNTNTNQYKDNLYKYRVYQSAGYMYCMILDIRFML